MGIELLATSWHLQGAQRGGHTRPRVARVSEAHPNILDMIASGTVDLVINTPTRGRRHDTDGFKIRRSTVEHSVAASPPSTPPGPCSPSAPRAGPLSCAPSTSPKFNLLREPSRLFPSVFAEMKRRNVP